MKRLTFILAPPILCLGLLGAISAENRSHVKPADVEPYYTRTAQAMDQVPYRIGPWVGKDDNIPTPAIKLLRPNRIVSRTYVDTRPDRWAAGGRASLLIVQCRDAGDMVGHYPPKCYVSSGMIADDPVKGTQRTWTLDQGMSITGTEYEFTHRLRTETYKLVVYNFLLVPGKGIQPTMAAVEKSASDYQQRYYGATQFQLVFRSPENMQMSRELKDEAFKALIGANVPLIHSLMAGGMR